MPQENRPLRVFLCHSSNDKPAVRELYHKLDAEGWIDAWLDEEKLYPGQDWNLEIEKAVEEVDVIIVCLSNNSVTKEGYIQRELRLVLDQADYKPEGTLFIIPVRFEECEPPRRLRRWQYADYFPKSDRDRAYKRFLASLRNRAEALGIVADKADSERLVPPPIPDPITKTTPNGCAIYTFGNFEFVKVAAGKFLMGSGSEDDQAYNQEQPQHIVNIPYDYYIARFPVTNEQYATLVKAKERRHPSKYGEKKRDHPVVNMGWFEAMDYCRWLNDLLESQLPFGYVLRLPTEAEWEKAARWKPALIEKEQKDRGEALIYPWGNSFHKNKCNTSESRKEDTTPVDMYSPQGDSPYGCTDMSGNVFEWTHSRFKSYPYEANDGRESRDPYGDRVFRGGCFDLVNEYARCAYREKPYGFVSAAGFRMAVAPSLHEPRAYIIR